MSIKGQLPDFLPDHVEAVVFDGTGRGDAADLLTSVMYHEIVKMDRHLTAKGKKASQDFILECFRALTGDPEEGHPASSGQTMRRQC